jgi:hypothetical protein
VSGPGGPGLRGRFPVCPFVVSEDPVVVIELEFEVSGSISGDGT